MEVIRMEDRLENITKAIDKVDESIERDLPKKFLLYSKEEIDLNVLDPDLELQMKKDGKTYLLFGSRPWNINHTLKPKQGKKTKNIMKCKKPFKIGMVPEEFYSSGEEDGEVPTVPKVELTKSINESIETLQNDHNYLEPPKELNSLEVMDSILMDRRQSIE